jgi:hypothetical protein
MMRRECGWRAHHVSTCLVPSRPFVLPRCKDAKITDIAHIIKYGSRISCCCSLALCFSGYSMTFTSFSDQHEARDQRRGDKARTIGAASAIAVPCPWAARVF